MLFDIRQKMTGEVRLDGKKYRKWGIQNAAKASKP